MRNFVGLFNHENAVGEALFRGFSRLLETEAAVLTDVTAENFENLIKSKLKDDNVFIFNSQFMDELKGVDLDYSDKICLELNHLFRTLQTLIKALLVKDKRGKFLFITTNPSVSHCLDFPISPIHDEAIHSLIRSLAKEFKSAQIAFHGICVEPIFEMVDKIELQSYRKKMKVYGLQKSPIKLDALVSFVKNVALTDFRPSSGHIFYIAEGLDQMNF